MKFDSKYPRYTQPKLSMMVRDKLKDISVNQASEDFDVEDYILNDILSGVISFKLKHYEVISKITSHSIEHLLSDVEMVVANYEGDSSDVKSRVEVISRFFNEVSMLKDTHDIYNKTNKEVVFTGSELECTSFMKGLDYGDVIDEDIGENTIMREIDE